MNTCVDTLSLYRRHSSCNPIPVELNTCTEIITRGFLFCCASDTTGAAVRKKLADTTPTRPLQRNGCSCDAWWKLTTTVNDTALPLRTRSYYSCSCMKDAMLQAFPKYHGKVSQGGGGGGGAGYFAMQSHTHAGQNREFSLHRRHSSQKEANRIFLPMHKNSQQ